MNTRSALLTALLLLTVGCSRENTAPAGDTAASPDQSAQSPSATGISSWTRHRSSPSLDGAVDTTFPRRWQTDWTRHGPDSPVTGLAVTRQALFVAHANGTVLRLSRDGQDLHWQRELEDQLDAPLLVAGGHILLGSLEGRMLALRTADGTLAWSYQTEDAIHGGANLVEREGGAALVVFGSYDSLLYALDLDSGDLAWRHPTKNYVNGTPAVLNGAVIASGCDGRVRRLRADNGEEVFATTASSYVPGAPAVRAGRAIVAGHDGSIAAVFADDGSLAWRSRPEESRHSFVLSPGTNGDCVLVSSQDGLLFCRAFEDGSLRWQTALPSPATTAPLLGSETVLLGTEGGTLEQRLLSSGEAVSSTLVGAAISCDLAVTPWGLLLGTEQGLILHLTGRP